MKQSDRRAITAQRNKALWDYLQTHSQAATGEYFGLAQGRVSIIAKQYAKAHGLGYNDKRRKGV